jgi:hypothetical protein
VLSSFRFPGLSADAIVLAIGPTVGPTSQCSQTVLYS